MENQQYMQEDEIDLRNYINVVVKRKKLVLSIFLIAVVISTTVNFLMPKVYEATSTVQLGNVEKPLISKEEAKEIILNQNSLVSIIKELNLKIEIENLKKNIKITDINGTDLLTIKVVYPGLDAALKINEAIVNPLIARGQSIYQERLILINERLKELDAQIKNAEKDIDRAQNLISEISNSGNISQSDASLRIILLQNTLFNYESSLPVLRNQRNKMKLSLANAKDFKIFDQPVKPKKPIGPKKTRNVLTAGIVGLMFGIFLAFFLEFWQKDKDT